MSSNQLVIWRADEKKNEEDATNDLNLFVEWVLTTSRQLDLGLHPEYIEEAT